MSLLKSIIKTVLGYKEIEVKVAGVTFSNDDGTKRQSIIRKIKFKDKPFETTEITFSRYDYEGELAISVLANGVQIGNVPKEQIDEFDKKWTGQYLIERYDVKGSGRNVPFGFTVKVLFDK